MKPKKGQVGLALGGGGARGWAHIGVINAIQDFGLEIQCVAGTSMGAVVGAAFASGKLGALQAVAMDLDWKRVLHYFLEPSLPRMGLIDGTRIAELLKEHISPVNIEELPLPFAAVATDVLTGDEVVLTEGSVIDAVRASMAIPGIFTPLVRDKRVLVDGGLLNPLPVNVARQLGADVVIAVDITRAPLPARRKPIPRPHIEIVPLHDPPTESNHSSGTRQFLDRLNARLHRFNFGELSISQKWFVKDDLPNIFEVYGNTMRIVQRQITTMRLKLEPPDVLIQPDVQGINTMEFHRAAEAVRAGYAAAREALANGVFKAVVT